MLNRKQHSSFKRFRYYVILVLSFGAVGFYHFQQWLFSPHLVSMEYYMGFKEDLLEPGQYCQIPQPHPFDPSILGYLKPPNPIRCHVRWPYLTMVDQHGILRFNRSGWELAGYSSDSLACFYEELFSQEGSDDVITSEPKMMSGEDCLTSDFVTVWCKNLVQLEVYRVTHAHVRPKRNLPVQMNSLSVLVLSFDSTSRLNFMRYLPNSYAFVTQGLKAHVMKGFGRVGDNTFPNLIAILTGHPEPSSHIKLGCPLSPSPLTFDGVGKQRHYDHWPFIWKNFSDRNYVTMMAEDVQHLSLFNANEGGFLHKPTDHYMRPFWLTVENSAVFRISSPLCYGNVPKHLVAFQYLQDFVIKYRNTPTFAFMHLTQISHDHLNQIGTIDEDLMQLLKSMNNSGVLDNMALFLMSDHGHRFSLIRNTVIGRIEESMPFLAVRLPEHLMEQHPTVSQHLANNTLRLTSMFDVHETMMHLLQLDDLDNDSTPCRWNSGAQGISLLKAIPASRTCQMAGIPEEYCICESEVQLLTTDPLVASATQAIMNELHQMVNDYPQYCSPLTLLTIKSANQIVAPEQRSSVGSLIDSFNPTEVPSKIRVTIETAPNHGLYQALVKVWSTVPPTVVGDISRINKYGNEYICLPPEVVSARTELRKFCFCKKLR